MTEKQWYLQREQGGNGFHEFWDSYLHAGCELIKQSNSPPSWVSHRTPDKITCGNEPTGDDYPVLGVFGNVETDV